MIERCEQNPQFRQMMQRPGNIETTPENGHYNQQEQSSRERVREETTVKQTLRHKTEQTASNARVRAPRSDEQI